jgi:hypothetical protein
MTATVQSPAGEVVAVAVLHAGDEILLPDGTDVLIRRIIRGSTMSRACDSGHNVSLCDWVTAALPQARGTTPLGSEDMVTRLHIGLAA